MRTNKLLRNNSAFFVFSSKIIVLIKYIKKNEFGLNLVKIYIFFFRKILQYVLRVHINDSNVVEIFTLTLKKFNRYYISLHYVQYIMTLCWMCFNELLRLH